MRSIGLDCSACEFKLVEFGFNIVLQAGLDLSKLGEDLIGDRAGLIRLVYEKVLTVVARTCRLCLLLKSLV